MNCSCLLDLGISLDTALTHPLEKFCLLKVDEFAVRTIERQLVLVGHLVETALGDTQEERCFLQIKNFLCNIQNVLQNLDAMLLRSTSKKGFVVNYFSHTADI